MKMSIDHYRALMNWKNELVLLNKFNEMRYEKGALSQNDISTLVTLHLCRPTNGSFRSSFYVYLFKYYTNKTTLRHTI